MPDDGVGFSQVSMGRSFALNMGALIPKSDQRLGKLRSSLRLLKALSDQFMRFQGPWRLTVWEQRTWPPISLASTLHVKNTGFQVSFRLAVKGRRYLGTTVGMYCTLGS